MKRVAVTRVTVTGSECTGKTTLAAALARRYETGWVPEFARRFVEQKGAPPTAADVGAIARGQIALEEEVARGAGELLILDTDLLSTLIYAEHYYGACPAWIGEAFARRAADLYLLADVDVPWVAEVGQRDRGDRRGEMQGLFRDALARRALPFVEIRGAHAERMRRAVAAIDGVL